MKTVTQWFDAAAKPVKIGVYETKFCEQLVGWSNWNGREWSCEYPDYERAAVNPAGHGRQDKRWRGLAEEPK